MTGDEERDERMLCWIASSLGYRLDRRQPASDKAAPSWRIICDSAPAEARADFMGRVCAALRIPRVICPFSVTLSFFSPTKLLDDILTSKTAFMNPSLPSLPNPFFGMSREELKLRMAVAG